MSYPKIAEENFQIEEKSLDPLRRTSILQKIVSFNIKNDKSLLKKYFFL